MSTFASEVLFIDSVTDMAAKVEAIDAIIAALLVIATSAAGNEDIEEYTLDDGQTKIRTRYRGMSAILKAIQDYEKLRQMYLNRLNGRVIRLVDSRSVLNRLGLRNL